MSGKSSALLIVVSILFILSGALVVVFAFAGILAGTVGIAAGMPALGVLLVIGTILLCLSGVLQFVAGVMGIRGKNIGGCIKIAIVILVITGVGIVFQLSGSSFELTSLSGLILPILYLIGAKQSEA